jgi:dihydrolipoamide dehydrogenase
MPFVLRENWKMNFEIRLRDFVKDASSAKVVRILKDVGDALKIDTPLFDLETNKTTATIKPGIIGQIQSINVSEGDTVKADTILASISGEKPDSNVSTIHAPASDDKTPDNTFDYFATLLKPSKQTLKTDIAVIGAGPGGYVAAIHAAKLGAKVALIEKANVGGTCLNAGCIPTKALARSAEVFSLLQTAKDYGCESQDVTVDIARVVDRKDKIVKNLVDGIHYLLKRHKIALINGTAEFVDTRQISVKDGKQETIVSADHIIIATGSKCASLPIPGLDLPNIMDSTDILSIDKLPKRLVIIGGGVIGMEFAFIFNSFGVDVSVIEYFDQILPTCDSDVHKEISRSARNKGIKLYAASKVKEVLRAENDECVVCFERNDKLNYISTEKVLLSVGRDAYTEGLNLSILGLELDRQGGITHDYARDLSSDDLLRKAREFGIVVGRVEQAVPVLLHGPVGAVMIEKRYGISDPLILNAVRYHTTGKENMSLLEKIIYLADCIEPGRMFPGVADIRAFAYVNLDAALLSAFDTSINYLIQTGGFIHTLTIRSRNQLLKQSAGSGGLGFA